MPDKYTIRQIVDKATEAGINPTQALVAAKKSGKLLETPGSVEPSDPIRGAAIRSGALDSPAVREGLQYAPDVLQAAGAVGGGALGGVPGAAIGGAAGSAVANTLHSISPSTFGEATTIQKEFLPELSFSGKGLPQTAANVLDDVTLDLATIGMGDLVNIVRANPRKLMGGSIGGRALSKIAKTELSPEQIVAYEAISRKIAAEEMPTPFIGHSSGPVRAFAKIVGPSAVEDFLKAQDDKVKIALPKLAGTGSLETGRKDVSKALAEAQNKSPLRRSSVKIDPGEFSASNKQAMQFAAGLSKQFRGLRLESNRLWNTLRRTIGDQDFSLSPETIRALGETKTMIDELSNFPELRDSLMPLKRDIDALLQTPPPPKPTFRTTKKTVSEEIIKKAGKDDVIKTGSKKATAEPTKQASTSFDKTRSAGNIIQTRQKTVTSDITRAQITGQNVNLLANNNGRYKFEQLHQIQTALAGDINWTKVNQTFPEKERIVLYNRIKDEIASQIKARPDGDAVTDLYQRAIDITRERYTKFNHEVRRGIEGHADQLWDKVFKDETTAKEYIKAAGGTGSRGILSARTEAVTRLIDKASTNGDLNPAKLLNIWENSPGLQAAFSNKQKKNLDQYFTILQSVDTSKLSEVGNVALALRGGQFAIATTAGLLTGGGIPVQSGVTVTALVGMHQFVKHVMLNDGEFARAALRLSKSTVKQADPADIKKVLTALHGTKMILQDQDGAIIDSDARIDSKRNRSFRTPNEYETDVLRNTGKFKKTRPAGFGTIGSARR